MPCVSPHTLHSQMMHQEVSFINSVISEQGHDYSAHYADIDANNAGLYI